jgi:hypothetical protein
MLRRLFYRWEAKLAERDQNRVIRPFEWGVDFIGGEQPEIDPRTQLKRHATAALEDSDLHTEPWGISMVPS